MTNRYSATWFEIFLESIQTVQTETEIAFLTRHLPNPPYTTVLDVCCGPGRHARLLAAQGYQVTGVDADRAALDKAGRLSGGQVVYRELDMRRLADLSGSFDAVINLWQSFGYFDESANADVLRQISGKLNPRGRLVLDIYHRGFFEQRQGAQRSERSGVAITETKYLTGNRLAVKLDYDGREQDRFEWQLYTPDEIVTLAGRYGLTPLICCTGFDERQPASADHPRTQIVLENADA
jgi:SAM-dependent methyltransferase